MKLLLAIDASPSSEAMANEIASRPWPEGTVACVLNVTDLFSLAYGFPSGGQFASEEMKASEAIVKTTADKLASRGIETTTEIIEGYPPTAIVDYAEQWGADFVIIGSHGHGRIARFLLGSVARVVVRSAPCSVEIVRVAESGESQPEAIVERGAMKMLLATDGSDCSVAAARSVAERPWPEGTEVKVVSVVDVIAPTIEPWYVSAEVMENLREETLRRAQEAAQAAGKMLSDAGLKSTEEVLSGSPKALIVDTADEWGADLIVVGSHGRRGLSRLMLGSVSEAVAMHAHCSVEVVRQRAGSHGA